jgi:ABC-2 type transport system permease protein
MLNTLLYFPSGAVYPAQGLPGWLQAVSRVDPFTYAVHALRVLLLKGAALNVLLPDLLFLAAFATVMTVGSVVLFRRTL